MLEEQPAVPRRPDVIVTLLDHYCIQVAFVRQINSNTDIYNQQLRNHTQCLLNLLLLGSASELSHSSEMNVVKVKLFSSLFLLGSFDLLAVVMRLASVLF